MGRVVLGLHFGPPMAVFGNLMTIDSARFVRRSVPGEAGCIAQIDSERVNLCPDKGVGGKNLCLAGDLPNLPVVRMAEGKSEWVRLGQFFQGIRAANRRYLNRSVGESGLGTAFRAGR